MADREKVIRGLEACNRQSYNGSDCQNCPYYDDEDTAELPSGICNIQDMFDDALALLKEQGVQKVVYTINPFTGLSVSYCPKCGKQIDMFRAGVDVPVRFCGYCGQEVAWDG